MARPPVKTSQKTIKYKTEADAGDSEVAFTASSDTDLSPDEYRTIATLNLEEGEAVSLGRGTSENPLQAQGFIYGEFYDDQSTPVQFLGDVRVTVRTKAGNLVGYWTEQGLEEIDEGANTRSDRKPFSIKKVNGKAKIAHPYVIHLEVRPDSAVTFNYDADSNALKADGYHHER